MSRKPRTGQIETTTAGFSKILSGADTDVQLALDTVDQHNHTVGDGGTEIYAYVSGDLIYADGVASLTTLPIGAADSVLTSDGSIPYWAPNTGGDNSFDHILVGKIDVLTPGSTLYLLPNYSESNNEDFICYIADGYGILDNLFIHAGTASGVGEDAYFTVRVDGYDTILSATLSDNNTDVTNTISQVAINSGSKVTIEVVTSAGCLAADVFVSVRYTQYVVSVVDYILVGKVGIITPNVTRYLLPNFSQATTESFPAYLIPQNGTIDNLRVYCATAPGVGDDITITVRIGGFDTLLTTTISNADTEGEDLINSGVVASSDLITIKAETSVTCAAADVFVSIRYSV